MATTSVPRGLPAANFRRNPSSPWRHLDLLLVGATIAVACLGVLMVYSATRSTVPEAGVGESTTYLLRQSVFVVVGVAVMVAVAFIDYGRYRDVAPLVYAGGIFLLLAVLSPLGTAVNGAQSWFAFGSFQLQPAEFMKLAVILVVAALGATQRERLETNRLLLALAVLGVPAGLIMLQPDVGSTMVFGAIGLGMLVIAGATPRHLVVLFLIVAIGMIGVFEGGFIKSYQRDRLTYFANPGDDNSTAAYNSEQAQTAIGAGGFTGTGLFKGTQTKLRYVPYQQSDFIFTVVGEELGFVGGATLLLLYAAMAWRIWRAANVARDAFGTLLCVGVLSMLLFQIFENMGMTMGIMPITGIPLPFLSYGGSSTIAEFAAIGLVLNVHTRRFS
jgi:rod shape determining protein RodA